MGHDRVACDGSTNRAHELPEVQRGERVGEEVGVRVVPLVLEDGDGARPAMGGLRAHQAACLAARDEPRVLPSSEEGDEVVVEPATAVEARVQDKRLLGPVLAERIAVDAAERAVAHAPDVYVADASVREAVRESLSAADPAFVEETPFGAEGDGADHLLAHLSARFGGQREQQGAARLVVEQCPRIHVG
jgi:hypothetical protein